jgi:hypothetical protein
MRIQYHVAKAGTLGPQGVFTSASECARFVSKLFRDNDCNEVRVWRVQRVPQLRRQRRAKVSA